MAETRFVRMRIATAIAATLLGATPASHAAAPARTEASIAISCTAKAREAFDRGLIFLHSFEYHEARKLFDAARAEDGACAMARWGAAMTLWHPLWAPPGAGDLKEGARLLDEAQSLVATGRESVYIAALSAFFADANPATHRDRAGAYEKKMAAAYLADLDDKESALFYALALLASADPRDKTYANQFKAAGVLNWVGADAPRHPGVLHYLIHAYDFPGLAHLALPAALVYAEVAPDSAHAQHMPSHIFTRLGMWDRALASNRDSTRSAAEYTHRAHLKGHYDEGLHSIDYLMYALLQTGRDGDAAKLLAELGSIGKASDDNFKVAFTYASSPARYALERRRWKEASELALAPREFPWAEFPWAQSITHFARGIGAARMGDATKAEGEVKMLESLQASLAPTTLPYWREQVAVQIDSVKSWALLARGDAGRALAASSAAADREDAVDKHPVTPGEVLPARELYADMLMETGDAAAALTQYEIVLAQSPKRLNALIGAAAAAEASGNAAKAEALKRMAAEQARFGDGRGRGGA